MYTTNQHTYLEQAYQEKGLSFAIQMHANGTDCPEKDGPIMIHKLYGSINSKEEDAGPDCLPLTEYDHRQHKTMDRVTQLWQQLATAVHHGSFILMLCPSEDELMSAYQYCQPANAEGLVWLAGGDISEEEQDVYRNLDFRVLPDDSPSQLLKVLFTLTNYDDEDIPGLTKE